MQRAYRDFVCACLVSFCVQKPSRFEEKSFVLTWNILLPISLFKIMFKYRSPDIETVYLLLLCSRELFQSKALYLQKYQAPKSVESWMNHQNLVLSSSILDAELIYKVYINLAEEVITNTLQCGLNVITKLQGLSMDR